MNEIGRLLIYSISLTSQEAKELLGSDELVAGVGKVPPHLACV